MALVATTLASACAIGDLSINVASATGSLIKNLIQIDNEFMTQTADSVGTVLAVRRGVETSYNRSHNSGAVVIMGLPSEFAAPPPGTVQIQPFAPTWSIATYTAAGAIAIPASLINVYVKLSAATGVAMTLADPSLAVEGMQMLIQAEAAQAYTVSNAAGSGFNSGGGGTDVGTFGGAIGDNIWIKAVGGKWNVIIKTNVTLG
jgi:hypothetical protein